MINIPSNREMIQLMSILPVIVYYAASLANHTSFYDTNSARSSNHRSCLKILSKPKYKKSVKFCNKDDVKIIQNREDIGITLGNRIELDHNVQFTEDFEDYLSAVLDEMSGFHAVGENDFLHRLPLVVMIPLSISEKLFDLSTSAVAYGIRTLTINPMRRVFGIFA